MSDRIDKVNEQVLQALSALVRTLKDPRLNHFYSLTHVDVSRDFRFAKVYVSVLANEREARECLKGLSSAAGFLRRELGRALPLHHTPELTFLWDHSMEHGAKINELLTKEAKNGEPGKTGAHHDES